MVRDILARHELRLANDVEEPWLHDDCSAHTCVWHRGEHSDLQRGESTGVQSPALRRPSSLLAGGIYIRLPERRVAPVLLLPSTERDGRRRFCLPFPQIDGGDGSAFCCR